MVIVSWHSCLFLFLNRMNSNGGEQIIEFIILTNLFFFFVRLSFWQCSFCALTAVHLRLLLWLKQIHVELKRLLFKILCRYLAYL